MVGQLEMREGLALDDKARLPAPDLERQVLLEFADDGAQHLSHSAAIAYASETTPAFRFRHYSLSLGARLLLRSGEPVALGGRAFDLLYVLLSARGQVVERAELMRRVWPTTVVEESNLRFQVACARRALGPDRDLIKSVAGRGYFFVDEPNDAAAGWGANPLETELDRHDGDQSAPAVSQSPLPHDPTGAQTPEDYRAACELLRELLNSVLHELRELRGFGPPESAVSSPNHLVCSDRQVGRERTELSALAPR
jgi:DNA-binding winged helix-turn-helix (wHTH) protein